MNEALVQGSTAPNILSAFNDQYFTAFEGSEILVFTSHWKQAEKAQLHFSVCLLFIWSVNSQTTIVERNTKYRGWNWPFFPSTLKMQLLEIYIKCFTWISAYPRFNWWTLFTIGRDRDQEESFCLLVHTSILLYIFIKYVLDLY